MPNSNFPDTSSEFFERLYQSASDPWNFRKSDYERHRFDAIVAAIADRRYRLGFEPGCSIGELSLLLGNYCDQLDAVDFSASAIRNAKESGASHHNINFQVGSLLESPSQVLPEPLSSRRYDLIVFAELGYYFSRQELLAIASAFWQQLVVGGRLVACHWLGRSSDHRLTGEETVAALAEAIPAPVQLQRELGFKQRDRRFVLQRWEKTGATQ